MAMTPTSPSNLPVRQSLWDVEASLRRAWDLLEDNDGAHDPTAEALVVEHLDTAAVKREQIAHFLQVTRAWDDHLGTEIERLRLKRELARRARERLMSYVIDVMKASGVRELQGVTSSLKIVKNPPGVQIANDAEVPEEFVRTKIIKEPDKTALKEALNSGRHIRGVFLVQGERLVIR